MTTRDRDGNRIIEVRRYQRGTDRYNAKLTPEKVRYIRANMSVKNIALAAEVGCSKSNVEMVKHFKIWKHIT